MNKRQVTIFWLIAIALGAAVYALKNKQDQASISATLRAPGQTLFASFPATDIATLEIQGAAGTVTITKKDGKWTVAQREGYPANATYVNDLIRTLGDLKVVRAMEAGPSFAPRFGMDESSANAKDRGLTATFKDAAGKEIAKVALGKNIDNGAEPSPMMGGGSVGRYVRNFADTNGFYAVSEMFPSVTAEVPRWLADDFISPEKIKAITLSQKGKDDPEWKLSRQAEESEVKQDSEFKLEGALPTESLDSAVVSPLKTLFSYARFEDVVPSDKVAERADAAAKRTATIETFEGFVYTITITPTKAGATPPPAITSPDAPPPATDNYFLTVSVTAELPKERKKAEGEKPEDAKTKDEAFTERLKTLTDKLTKEKALAGRTFEVGKSTVDALLKDRAQLIAKPTTPTPADSNTGSVQKFPGGAIVSPPPGQATTPPVEITTPPAETTPANNDAKQPAAEPAKPAPDANKPAANPRVEAVTPPITIPPADDKKPAEGKQPEQAPAADKAAPSKE